MKVQNDIQIVFCTDVYNTIEECKPFLLEVCRVLIVNEVAVISSVHMLFGGFACSTLADKMGRRAALLCGILFCTGGAFGEMFSLSKGAFLASKLILGIGLGFYLTIGPLVCSEISTVVLRGISTAGINLDIAIGHLLSNAVVKGFSERTDRWAYAAPFAI